MEKKAKGNILANTKIANDKTYQDFNKEALDPRDPNQSEAVKIQESAEENTDVDVDAIPHVGARDKNVKSETAIKTNIK